MNAVIPPKPDTYPKTPELDKLKAVAPFSQKIGEFVDIFLMGKGVMLGKPHVHTDKCPGWDKHRGRYNPDNFNRCSYRKDDFEDCHQSLQSLLAEFFEIDMKKVEEERRAVLEYVRNQNDRKI